MYSRKTSAIESLTNPVQTSAQSTKIQVKLVLNPEHALKAHSTFAVIFINCCFSFTLSHILELTVIEVRLRIIDFNVCLFNE